MFYVIVLSFFVPYTVLGFLFYFEKFAAATCFCTLTVCALICLRWPPRIRLTRWQSFVFVRAPLAMAAAGSVVGLLSGNSLKYLAGDIWTVSNVALFTVVFTRIVTSHEQLRRCVVFLIGCMIVAGFAQVYHVRIEMGHMRFEPMRPVVAMYFMALSLQRGAVWPGIAAVCAIIFIWLSGFRGVATLAVLGCVLLLIAHVRVSKRHVYKLAGVGAVAVAVVIAGSALLTDVRVAVMERFTSTTTYLRFARFWEDTDRADADVYSGGSLNVRLDELDDVLYEFNGFPLHYAVGAGYGWKFPVVAGHTPRGGTDGYQHNIHITPVMLLARNGVCGFAWYGLLVGFLGWSFWRRSRRASGISLYLGVATFCQALGLLLANLMSRPYFGITVSLFLVSLGLPSQSRPGTPSVFEAREEP